MPKTYLAEYSFKLKEPIDDNHGGYATLYFQADKDLESAEDWKELSRVCFAQGEGKYSTVQLHRVGEVEDPTLITPEIEESLSNAAD